MTSPSRRSSLRTAVIAALAVAALSVIAFLITLRLTSVDESALARFRPPPLATPAESATALPLGVVAERALPSVVTIEVETDQGEEFGTGWLFDSKGDFVTNYHVIAKRNVVRIVDRRDTVHAADVVGQSVSEDIAVIRSRDGFHGDALTVDRATPPVPEPVVVLASRKATGQTDETYETLDRLHQPVPVQGDVDLTPGSDGGQIVYSDMMVLRDTKIYRGNSGGPVLDPRGRVVGIVTLASQSTPQAFAIPIGTVLADLVGFAARP
jgi:putative serine protease PepD